MVFGVVLNGIEDKFRPKKKGGGCLGGYQKKIKGEGHKRKKKERKSIQCH